MLWIYHRTEGIVHVEGSAGTEIVGDDFVCRSARGDVIARYPRLDVLAITDKPNLLPYWRRAIEEQGSDEEPPSEGLHFFTEVRRMMQEIARGAGVPQLPGRAGAAT